METLMETLRKLESTKSSAPPENAPIGRSRLPTILPTRIHPCPPPDVMKFQLHLALPVTVPLVAALVLPLGSCNATTGAAAGALIGAGLGQLAGGDTEATLMGAALGASIGALYGYSVEKKREARVLESREATRAELEAANQAASAVPASSREQKIALAKAYEAEHAVEYQNPAPMRVLSVPSVLASGSEAETTTGQTGEAAPEAIVAEPTVGAAPVDTPTTPEIAEPNGELAPVLVEALRLPGGGVVLKDLETGTFIDNEVHMIDEIWDVSTDADHPVLEEETEVPVPFTLILSDKETGQPREYTAIYSA